MSDAGQAGGTGSLTGRVALVTGSTSGIGRAAALGLATEGCNVVVTGRSQERGIEVVAAIEAAGGTGSFVAADITSAAACQQLVDSAVERYGKLDILVNSAGMFPLGPAVDVTEADYDAAFTTNVKGPFFCGTAALRHMVERGEGGRIINLASIAGLIGFTGAVLYTTTKGAILAMTKNWAVEFAPQGILVNAIAPGNIETPMNDALMADAGYKAQMLAMTPAGRNGQVEDIVPAIVLLAGDGGSYFCGATLVIDGGWTAQ